MRLRRGGAEELKGQRQVKLVALLKLMADRRGARISLHPGQGPQLCPNAWAAAVTPRSGPR